MSLGFKVKRPAIDELYRRLAVANPHPKSELNFKNPYTLLVAAMLSARATDKSVNKATKGLFKAADTPEGMLALGEEGLKSFIKTIGLYNSKARNIMKLSQILANHHDGAVPNDLKALESFPGVGRKTASVVLNAAFGQPLIAVDTHVFRVANRTGLAPGKTPLEVARKLEKRTPDKWKQNAHHWLILHGRYVCKARKPDCERCAINDLCQFSA